MSEWKDLSRLGDTPAPQEFEVIFVNAEAILDLVGFESSERLRELARKDKWKVSLEVESFGTFPRACVEIDTVWPHAEIRSNTMRRVIDS
jgi:hypothetical protein